MLILLLLFNLEVKPSGIRGLFLVLCSDVVQDTITSGYQRLNSGLSH